MIPKSGYRFSEKIMLKEQAKAKWRFNLRPFGFMALPATLLAAALPAPAMAQSGTHSFSGLCAYYPAHGNGLTAAHRTLPFGTRLRVTDPKTGRSVTVLINDRGPFGRHRVLDVSPSAARALGMMGRGVIFVQAEVL
jgi:rare lipoprotein A